MAGINSSLIKLEKDLITINGDKSSKVVDDLVAGLPLGRISTSIGDTFYGMNHRQLPNLLPINKEHYGLTFFTRPAMNMQAENLRAVRQLTPLLTGDNNSLARILRCIFDPSLATKYNISSPFVDKENVFINFLSNLLVSVSGWPDMEVRGWSSDEGLYKESYGFADDLSVNYSSYNLSCEFRNIHGDPVTALFYYWLHYQSFVYQGRIVPYITDILNRRIDYVSRMYRIVLDHDNETISKIACCGYMRPTGISIGSHFDYDISKPINDSYDSISVSFEAYGYIPMDDIVINWFNGSVALMNRSMKDPVTRRQLFVKVPRDLLILFNHRGYPWIDTSTYKLEWWVPRDTFNQITAGVK